MHISRLANRAWPQPRYAGNKNLANADDRMVMNEGGRSYLAQELGNCQRVVHGAKQYLWIYHWIDSHIGSVKSHQSHSGCTRELVRYSSQLLPRSKVCAIPQSLSVPLRQTSIHPSIRHASICLSVHLSIFRTSAHLCEHELASKSVVSDGRAGWIDGLAQSMKNLHFNTAQVWFHLLCRISILRGNVNISHRPKWQL